MSSACSAPRTNDPGRSPSPGRSASGDLIGHAHLVRLAASESAGVLSDRQPSRVEAQPGRHLLGRGKRGVVSCGRVRSLGGGSRSFPRHREDGGLGLDHPTGSRRRPPRARRARAQAAPARRPRSLVRSGALIIPPSAGRNRSRNAVASEESEKERSPGIGSSPGISRRHLDPRGVLVDGGRRRLRPRPACPRPSCSTSRARVLPAPAVPSSAAADPSALLRGGLHHVLGVVPEPELEHARGRAA